MWIIADYQPTAFFSLRPHTATSSGGKSLIVPTPYAIKTALLDAAIRTQGLAQGRARFADLRALEIAARLPRRIVVNNTFAKTLRVKEIKVKATEKAAAISQAIAARQWPYQQTIAFREYVHFDGPLALAFRGMEPDALVPLLLQVNYLGKRGGFVQLCAPPEMAEALPEDFTRLTQSFGESFPLGTLQVVDDWGAALTFERLNIYSDQRITVGKHRIFHHVVLPLQPTRSSRNYTLYERREGE